MVKLNLVQINSLKKITLLLLTFSCFFILGQENKNKLQVKGQIVNSLGKVTDVTIRLVYSNSIIDTILASNGRYDILLPLENKILLEFISTNHYTKRIAFDTHVNGKKKLPFFDLKINLHEIDLWNLSAENLDLMDFPVAYIKYDFKKKIFFDFNQKYSKIISKELSTVKRN